MVYNLIMKKFLLVVLLFFTLNLRVKAIEMYDMTTPLEGESIASDALQKMVLKDIYAIAAKQNSLCSQFKISDTQLLHFPYDTVKKNGKYIKGYWKELWTVDYCDEKMQIPVSFTIKKKKTYFNVEKIN